MGNERATVGQQPTWEVTRGRIQHSPRVKRPLLANLRPGEERLGTVFVHLRGRVREPTVRLEVEVLQIVLGVPAQVACILCCLKHLLAPCVGAGAVVGIRTQGEVKLAKPDSVYKRSAVRASSLAGFL